MGVVNMNADHVTLRDKNLIIVSDKVLVKVRSHPGHFKVKGFR